MSYTQSHTLVLDMNWNAHRVIPWQRAYSMVFAGKAEELATYDDEAKSVTFTFKIPAVIRLLRAIPNKKKAVRFSRVNIATRDAFKCAYCTKKLTLSKLTYDHVLPRSRGGKTTWDNIVSACMTCNLKKRNQTPEEAGMRLLVKPYKPTTLPMTVHLDLGKNIPEAWRSFVYWHGELDQD